MLPTLWFGWILLWAVQSPADQLFRTPATPTPLPQESTLSCAEVEREIIHLLSQTYSFKPGFYQNPYLGGSILLGTTISQAFYAYPVIDSLIEYNEQRRIIPAEDRLERLRRVKADNHCFES